MDTVVVFIATSAIFQIYYGSVICNDNANKLHMFWKCDLYFYFFFFFSFYLYPINKSTLIYVEKCHIFVNDGTNLNIYLCISLTTINRITKNMSKWATRNMLPLHHTLLLYTNINVFICTGCDKSFMTTVYKHYLIGNLYNINYHYWN